MVYLPVTVSHPEWNTDGTELGCHTLDSVDVAGFREELEARIATRQRTSGETPR